MSGIVGTNAGRSSGKVGSAAIGADAITGDEIADDVLDSEHYVAASIDNEHLADNAVGTDEIADNAVTLAKMAGGTDGNIISFDASGNPVAIATGSDGQVLTSAGAGAPPAFETAGGGGLWQFSSSGSVDADFFQVMGFSTDIRLELDCTTTTDGLNGNVVFSTDGSGFLGSNYAYQVLHQTGASFDNSSSNSAATGLILNGGIGSASGESFCWVFETMDATNTATFIKTRSWLSFDHQGGAGSYCIANVANKAANNINGVKYTGSGLVGTYKIWTKITS